MKIEIDLMDNSMGQAIQIEAVKTYISKFGEIKKGEGFIGSIHYKTHIKETAKNTGHRLEVGSRTFHVSCSKTNGGTYKFKVWQAV